MSEDNAEKGIQRVRNSFGLILSSSADAASCFERWTNQILKPANFSMETKIVSGELSSVLSQLLPLVAPPTKSVFVSCKDGWTAIFENSHFGTDAGRIRVLAEKLNTRAMRIVARLETADDYPAVIWEVYDAEWAARRVLYAMNDGGRWEYTSVGVPFGFEHVEQYTATRIASRFTREMLTEYLSHFQAFPFSDDWFLPQQSLLVERLGGYLLEMPVESAGFH